MIVAGANRRVCAEAAEAWDAADKAAREWVRHGGTGDGMIVADDVRRAAALSQAVDPHRLGCMSPDQLALTVLRRGALTVGLPPGCELLGAEAAREIDAITDMRLATRLIERRHREPSVLQTLREAETFEAWLALPGIAPRVARARRTARIRRAGISRADLRWATARIDRRRPQLWEEALGPLGLLIAVLDLGEDAAWRPRLSRLAQGPEPAAVWLFEAPAQPSEERSRPLDEPAVQELEQLAAVLEDPGDALAVVATLRGRMFGLSDEVLVRHRERGGSWRPRRYAQPSVVPGEPAVIEALDQLGRWAARRASRGVAPVLEQANAELRHDGFLRAEAGGAPEAAALRAALDQVHERELRLPADGRPASVAVAGMRTGEEATPERRHAGAEETEGVDWPKAAPVDVVDLTPGWLTPVVGAAEAGFELSLARHAIERLVDSPHEAEPLAATEVVERVLALTGRGQEDAIRAGALVRELWALPLLDRARAARRRRAGLDLCWMDRAESDRGEPERVVRCVIDLWVEDEQGRAMAFCDAVPWRGESAKRRRIDDWRELSRRVAAADSAPERIATEAWVMLLGGSAVAAERVL